jgi:CDP-6-deoxy-D-xylo-4-hexulose-3-dehydrase
MDEIMELCNKHNIFVIEDTCESLGSMYNNKKLGTIGLMGTYSLYFGHHASTIEGGIICTDDEDIYHLLLMIRSHGWDRDLPAEKVKELRDKYKIQPFRGLYTFYYPAFNLRSTDLQAFLGLEQIKKLDYMNSKRNENYLLYDSLIKNDYWKIKQQEKTYVSNFNYPIITTEDNFNKLVDALSFNEIETRPLICGSINQQPFWYERYSISDNVPNADYLHKYGLYLPNNHELKKEEIIFICEIVNKTLNNE